MKQYRASSFMVVCVCVEGGITFVVQDGRQDLEEVTWVIRLSGHYKGCEVADVIT